MTKRKTTEEFIAESTIVHNNKYDYSLVEYTTTYSKVLIRCPIHGQFHQTAKDHKHGCGCPKCGDDAVVSVRLSKSLDEKQASNKKRKDTNIKNFGVEYPLQNKDIHNKQIQTNLERFGVEFPLQNEEIHEKRKRTNLERFGVEYAQLNKEVLEKIENTNLERYGSKRPLGSGEIKEKIRQSNLERRGVEHPAQNKEVLEKMLHTNRKNHGGVHNTQHHMVKVLSLITNKDWMVGEYITKGKPMAQLALELRVGETAVWRYIHNHKIPIQHTYRSSSGSNSWIKSIIESEQIHIQHALNGGEYKIPGTTFHADGFCAETNTIYEFYGDYWHGNPKIFKPEGVNKTKNKTMGELHQVTIARETKIKELGYNLITMWESDFK
jgi:hypothetical protein